MRGFSSIQLEVAEILFGLPEAQGYALAGGSALLALGAIDRPTRDIDAFVGARPGTPPGDVGPLLVALERDLTGYGWTVVVDRNQVTFARLVVQRSGESVEIDLAVDSPPLFDIEVALGLPVLSGRDLAARKILAILNRAAGRDFTDLRALANFYSRRECVEWAQELDAGVRLSDIAEAFGKLGRLRDVDLPCPPGEVSSLREWFEDWAIDLRGPGA